MSDLEILEKREWQAMVSQERIPDSPNISVTDSEFLHLFAWVSNI